VSPAVASDSLVWRGLASDSRVWRGDPSDVLATRPVYRGLVLVDGAVGYWRLAEASGATFVDEAGHQNAALNSGSVGYGIASALAGDPADRALSFDGATSKIGVPFNAALYTDQWSVDGWFNLTINPSVNCPVFDCRPASSGALAAGFDLFLGTGAIGIAVCFTNVAQTSITAVPAGYASGNWIYAAATYDGAQVRLYLNAALAAGPTTCPFIKNPTAVAGIGHLAGVGGGNVVNGKLDEVAVYGSALSAAQLANHYRVGSAALGAIAKAQEALV
jgi:concanavalin A-like lectin/glucanase superfamily protein